MKINFLIILFLFTKLLISGAGMYITFNYEITSWSNDGKYVLVKENFYGPEGGGGFDYKIIGGENYVNEKYILSNDLSPGDGSTPEQVNIVEYIKTLKKLESSLKNKNFKNIKMKYLLTERWNSVQTNKEKAESVEFQYNNGTYSYGGIKLKSDSKKMDFYFKNKFIKSFPIDLLPDKIQLGILTDSNTNIIIIDLKIKNEIVGLYGILYSNNNNWGNPVFNKMIDKDQLNILSDPDY